MRALCKRTLKPDKELLARGGTEVALTDFGMATLTLAGSLSSGTHKGAGTPAIKAPDLFEVSAWCLLAGAVAPY